MIKDMDIAQNNGMYLQQGESSFGYDLYVKYESGESLSVKAYGDASSTCVFDIPRLMEYAAIKVPGYGEFKCGEAGSLEMMDSGEVGQVYDYRIPAVLADSDGNAVLSAHPQNEVYLSKDPDRNLMCITRSGEKIIRSGYIDVTSAGDGSINTLHKLEF